MTYFLLLTALSVSVDSFFCGFSLASRVKNKFLLVLGIALTVLVMCEIATYSALLLSDVINEKTASLGGIILVALGLYNLLTSKKVEGKKKPRNTLSQSIICGFAVGLDGATASLSLALMGFDDFYVPILIAVMHAVLIGLGIILSNVTFCKKIERFDFIPPLILIGLGVYKLLGLFL